MAQLGIAWPYASTPPSNYELRPRGAGSLPAFEEFTPYSAAIVKLDEGRLVTAQLTDIDPDQVRIGQEVEMVARKMRTNGTEGMIVYGYKFRLRIRV